MKTDPDHKPLDPTPLAEKEGEGGGWAQFEKWAGVTWFGDHVPYVERYGTIRCDKQVPSRQPIVERESRNGTEPNPKPQPRYPEGD